jgi:hypothetical protein
VFCYLIKAVFFSRLEQLALASLVRLQAVLLLALELLPVQGRLLVPEAVLALRLAWQLAAPPEPERVLASSLAQAQDLLQVPERSLALEQAPESVQAPSLPQAPELVQAQALELPPVLELLQAPELFRALEVRQAPLQRAPSHRLLLPAAAG